MKTIKRILFYLLSCTWGIIMTLIGAFIAIALLVTGHKPRLKNYGGFNCGMFFFASEYPSLHILQHEGGHGLQNIILGPFMLFISCWSALRYWWRHWQEKRGRGATLPPYESIWFEKWATRLGEKYLD